MLARDLSRASAGGGCIDRDPDRGGIGCPQVVGSFDHQSIEAGGYISPAEGEWSGGDRPDAGLPLEELDFRNAPVVVEVENLAHLEKIVKATRKVKGITDVARRERITAGE